MTAAEMKQIKEEYGLSYEDVSRETGLPVSTVSKLLNGFTRTPRRRTVERLSAYFMHLGRTGEHGSGMTMDLLRESGMEQTESPCILRENSFPYDAGGAGTKRQKHLVTIEERDQLPEEVRTELIDGVLYDMSAPSLTHQMVCRLVFRQLDDCAEASEKDCVALFAPVDVVLAEDPATVLQPDLIVTCRENIERSRARWKKLQKHQGAPEFVMEVLSSSTRKKDIGIKYLKYLESDVKEYWIVDPDSRKVIVYNLSAIRDEENHGDICCLYGPEQKVPVLLSEGRCQIDFPEIWKKIDAFLPA